MMNLIAILNGFPFAKPLASSFFSVITNEKEYNKSAIYITYGININKINGLR